jgi:prepilin-type N-terminal cleavage/methylation domain-containing protein
MLPDPSTREGFTLVELMITLLLIAILIALAAPPAREAIRAMRAGAALDQLTVQLYRARMLAAQSGRPVSVVLSSAGGECATAMRTVQTEPDGDSIELVRSAFDLPGLCLRHTGDSILVFDGRGLLRPPARSFFIEHGGVADRVVLSIAGRIRRAR